MVFEITLSTYFVVGYSLFSLNPPLFTALGASDPEILFPEWFLADFFASGNFTYCWHFLLLDQFLFLRVEVSS